jgi:drug/metabolite transporter (DMT)-like permease
LVIAFAILYLVWGSTYLGIRIAVETLPPFLLAGSRFVLAGFGLLLWARWRGAAWPSRGEWLGSAGVGTCLVVLSNAPIVWVEQRIDSGVVAVFAAGTPLLISVFNRYRLGIRLGTRRAFGLALGTIGLILLGSAAFSAVHDPARVAVLGMAMVAWAYGSTFGRAWPQPADIIVASGAQMFAGGVLAVLVGLLMGEGATFDIHAMSARSFLAWAYLTVFGSMIAYTAYQWLMQHVEATIVASYTYVNPIVALGLGMLLAGERPGPRVFVATLLLVPAVILVVTGPRQRTG